MRKELASKFAVYNFCNSEICEEIDLDQGVSNIDSPLDAILNEIFTPDPVTGLPKGDIAYYMSADGNPQVKDWIQRNLLQPRVVLSGGDPNKVSDDLIAEFGRNKGETNEQYAARLVSIRSEAEENLRKYQEQSLK